MSIKMINNDVCLNCKKETCAYIDVVTKNGTVFTSEGSVCPTGVLQSNPSLQANSPFAKKECLNCGLCVGYCNKKNLQIDNLSSEINLEHCNSFGLNALVSNYLNRIFSFAANSNRNSSILFDAYVEFGSEKEAFVEVDEYDALECCRNLMGDFLLYEGQYTDEIDLGVIVLQEIPKKGSNVYTVIEKMHVFPNLEAKRIYFATFSLLRYLFLNHTHEVVDYETLFFNPIKESVETYKKRIKTKYNFKV